MKKILVLSFAVAAAAANAQVWSGAGGNIPDFGANGPGVFTSTINAVPGLTSVSAIAIRGITHTWVGDLVATVTHVPTNTSFSLMNRVGSTTTTGVGDSSDLGGDYLFVNSGGLNLWTAAAAAGGSTIIAPGTYDASGFNGGGAASGLFPGSWGAGNWTLLITDNAGGDVGSLQSWEIRGQAVPEPATLAVLGLGALAAARRRRSK